MNNPGSKDYNSIEEYEMYHHTTKRVIKQKKAFEIMQIHFTMEEMGSTVLLNEQQTARYKELRESKDSLIKELYQLMKNDRDI
ncbi:unnamed protein product [Didymodactylos carnosus]|uniref:Uncharacterized protein n=1 Tax=Didymodactylos carnosus TaxID=1234261 RepID=A0A8S2EDY2_9BILA|nr:unnamed protein product [Didymodactylos carnosus]CAF4010230.1 unnamed protein product [Didymodactylos carnosus]